MSTKFNRRRNDSRHPVSRLMSQAPPHVPFVVAEIGATQPAGDELGTWIIPVVICLILGGLTIVRLPGDE